MLPLLGPLTEPLPEPLPPEDVPLTLMPPLTPPWVGWEPLALSHSVALEWGPADGEALEGAADSSAVGAVGGTPEVGDGVPGDGASDVEWLLLPLLDPLLELPVHRALVAGRTWLMATSWPHFSSTQLVASLWMAWKLLHTQAVSVTEHLVFLVTESSRQGLAQPGMPLS